MTVIDARRALVASIASLTLLACSSDERLPVGSDFTVVADQAYATTGERNLLLDLYLPNQPVRTPVPVVVAVRGGGFRSTDKAGFGPIAGGLADRGIAAVSIEYRPSSEALFPGALEDIKAAVRWLRANGDSFGLDGNAIGLMGGSAGGYLVTYAGVTDSLAEVEGDGGNAEQSSRVQAMVAMAPESGPSGLSAWTEFLGETEGRNTELRTFSSALTHIDAAVEPPLLLIHSRTDDIVPFSESERLLRAYADSDNRASLLELPLAPHAFWFSAGWFPPAINAAANFFARELAAPASTG